MIRRSPLHRHGQGNEKVPPAEYAYTLGRERVYRTSEDPARLFIYRRAGAGQRRMYGHLHACDECGREYLRVKSRGRFCGLRCERKGERNPMRRSARSRGVAKATADDLFSRLIRSAGACARCGESRPDRLQCAHIFSRRYLATRWDERNAVCLCAACHTYFTYRPIEWEDWISERIGPELYQEIRRLAVLTQRPDFEALIDRLLAKAGELRQIAGGYSGHWAGEGKPDAKGRVRS